MTDTTITIRPASREEYTGALKIDGYVIGGLLELYSRQTADEMITETTRHQNDLGFNAIDAKIMSNIANFYKSKGWLSPKQLALVRKNLGHYSSQLIDTEVTLMETSNMPQQKPQENQEKLVEIMGEKLKITFPFDPKTVGEVKKLSDRRWNPTQKYWTAPASTQNIQDLVEMKFKLNPEAQKIWEEINKEPEDVDLSSETALDGLFDFQKDGVAFIEKTNGHALIGDEMGLGKTVQALAYLKLHPEFRPAVVVCPASLKLNWKKEIEKWCPDDSVNIISGTTGAIGTEDIKIINYDILEKRLPTLLSLSKMIAVVIADEAHYTKNSKAKRTKAVQKLVKGSGKFIALTGTPIINKPVEFFTILNMVDPKRWSSFYRYANRYCDPKILTVPIFDKKTKKRKMGMVRDYSGASNIEELYEKIQPTMIRRKKEEVLKDLPPKTRTVIPIEISNKAAYKAKHKQIQRVIEEGGEKSVGKQLTRFEELKQLAVKGKMKAVIEWIENAIETNGKLVVFATHHATIDALMEKFGEIAVRLDGRDKPSKRQEAVETFQNDENCRLFVGNIKAAGVGITLTAAAATCFVELGWSPGEHSQAEDRIHRIGQEADNVSAYYLIAENTIESEIVELLDKKREVLDAVLDGKETESTDLLKELINIYKGEK